MKIVATIPARYGSKRVKQKNLRSIACKPLLCYAIKAAKDSKHISAVYVNTESDIIGKLALEQGVHFYKRPEALGSDETKSDEFNYEFMKKTPADLIVMVNPVSPLTKGEDIDAMIDFYFKNQLDTLITVKDEKLHSFFEESGLNFNPQEMLPPTQELEPVRVCCWSVCIWRPSVFMKQFEEKGHAVFSGKVGLYSVGPLKAIKISTEDEFRLAEILLLNEMLEP